MVTIGHGDSAGTATEVGAEFGAAAADWFAGNSGPAAFRRWVDGDRDAQRAQWRAFASLGLVSAIADTDDRGARAAIVCAVAREAGRHLYAGPLVEAIWPALCGVENGNDSLAILVRAAAGPAAIEAQTQIRLRAAPYASLADQLWLVIGDDAPRSVVVRIGTPRLDAVRDADGTPVGVRLDLTRSMGSDTIDVMDQWCLTPLILAALSEWDELGWLATSARLIGAAERVNELAREHLLARRQFGKPLAAFQALQHQAVDAHLEVQLGSSLLAQVSREWRRDDERRASLHALKAFAAGAALRASKTAVQHFGAGGFAHEGDAGLYLRHIVALAARGGDALEHRRQFSMLRDRLFD